MPKNKKIGGDNSLVGVWGTKNLPNKQRKCRYSQQTANNSVLEKRVWEMHR